MMSACRRADRACAPEEGGFRDRAGRLGLSHQLVSGVEFHHSDVHTRSCASRDPGCRGITLFNCSCCPDPAHLADSPSDLVLAVAKGSSRVAVRRGPGGSWVDRGVGRGFGAASPGAGPSLPNRDRSFSGIGLVVPEPELLRFCGQNDRRVLDPGALAEALPHEILAATIERLWPAAAGSDRLVKEHLADLVLLSVSTPAAGESELRGGLARWQLRRVMECMDANLSEDLALATLASLVGLSSNHFCTAFRESTGEPPHKFLVRRRITRAQELLADRRMSVTDVALSTGFSSSAHFTTSFRKAIGLTPSAYRQQMHS